MLRIASDTNLGCRRSGFYIDIIFAFFFCSSIDIHKMLPEFDNGLGLIQDGRLGAMFVPQSSILELRLEVRSQGRNFQSNFTIFRTISQISIDMVMKEHV